MAKGAPGLIGSVLLALGLLPTAASARAPDSHCAQLPASADALGAGAETVVRPHLTPAGLACPRGFVLEPAGAASRCIRAGAAVRERLAPRAACYRELPLGPVDEVRVARPAPGCQRATIETILALRGRNIGWADVSLQTPPASALTVTPLDSATARSDAEDPGQRGCFPHDCRLVRIIARAGTPARVELLLRTPGEEISTRAFVTTEPACPPVAPPGQRGR